MSYKIIISPQARQNLKNITKFIAAGNPARAKSFINELIVYFEQRLSHLPLSGKKIKGKIRMLPFKRYIILYMADEDKKLVYLLHIFAGGQDWENLI